MNHAPTAVSLVFSGLLVGACGGGSTVAASADGTMLTPYLAIGDTLAADKLDQLSELSAQVIKAADAHQGKPGVDAIIQGAGRVGAQDIKTARVAFKKMSDGMIEFLRAAPAKQSGHTIVHCPMTFANKGALWIQKSGKIMNPYEGAMMLHCGSKLDWDAELPET